MTKFVYLSLVALAISKASSLPHNVQEVSDKDLIDAKNLQATINGLDHFKRTTVEQYSDNDLIDFKNLNLNLPLLNTIKRDTFGKFSDDDLIDLKNANINVNALNDYHRGGISQSSHKYLHEDKSVKKHCFKGKDGKVVQYSDNDLIDLKNLGVNVAALNSVRRDIIESSDDDLIDGKNLFANIELLDIFNKRASIDDAMDTLRRADYDVDLLSMSKRASNDMYQYTDNTHTCFCAAKKACNSSPSAAPSSKPTSTHAKEQHTHKTHSHVLVPSPSHVTHHHTHLSKTAALAPVRTPIQSSSFSSISIPSPTKKPSCPSGWKHAGNGEVIKEIDNDLIDLSNLKLNINILNSGGKQEASKLVPATEKPTCTGEYCCYKTEKSTDKVIQKSDNDLLDLKNLGLNANLLNGLL